MGSGIFPLERDEDTGLTLQGIAFQIEAIANDLSEGIYSGDSGGMQFDNAASDGTYLYRLRLALRLLRECLESEKGET